MADPASAADGPRPKPAHNEARRRKKSHEAIIAATTALLSEVGYHNLTMEGIASRAGVGKATLYRWWASKGQLVGEALASSLEMQVIEDSGSPRRDLENAIRITMKNYAGSYPAVTVPALASDITSDPDLHETFLSEFVRPRRRLVAAVVERAIAAGLLPADADVELVLDIIGGIVLYRTLLSGQPIDDDFPSALMALLVREPSAEMEASSFDNSDA
jgi:AcrR family transcriptional regulator